MYPLTYPAGSQETGHAHHGQRFLPSLLISPIMSEHEGTIAIDVVLFPPEPVADETINANRTLLAGNPGGGIRLDHRDCLPHISVAMIPVRLDEFPAIVADVERIVRKCSPMTLTIDAIAKRRASAGEIVSAFHILRTEILQLFHKSVMKALEPYSAPSSGTRMFADEEVAASTVDCFLRFPAASAYRNYSPHITIGFGETPRILPGLELPMRFEVQKAAICHLGSHCTCRKVLAGFDLGTGITGQETALAPRGGGSRR
jgi:hypothetical protein